MPPGPVGRTPGSVDEPPGRVEAPPGSVYGPKTPVFEENRQKVTFSGVLRGRFSCFDEKAGFWGGAAGFAHQTRESNKTFNDVFRLAAPKHPSEGGR